jgi:hypothetical protein
MERAATPQDIRKAQKELNRLQVRHGRAKGAVMYLTGLSAQKIDELGGLHGR